MSTRRERTAPRVLRGRPITARWANALADQIDTERSSPIDQDTGGEVRTRTLTEIDRTAVTVRYENPDDDTIWVDVEEPTQVTLVNVEDGTVWVLNFDDPTA